MKPRQVIVTRTVEIWSDLQLRAIIACFRPWRRDEDHAAGTVVDNETITVNVVGRKARKVKR